MFNKLTKYQISMYAHCMDLTIQEATEQVEKIESRIDRLNDRVIKGCEPFTSTILITRIKKINNADELNNLREKLILDCELWDRIYFRFNDNLIWIEESLFHKSDLEIEKYVAAEIFKDFERKFEI